VTANRATNLLMSFALRRATLTMPGRRGVRSLTLNPCSASCWQWHMSPHPSSADPDLSRLLTPTLTVSDDVAEVREPWNPSTLLYLSFFFGLPAGGVLAALNYRRFGRAKRVFPTLMVAMVASFVLSGASVWLFLTQAPPFGEQAVRSVARLLMQGISVGVTYLLSRDQHRLFRAATLAHKTPGSLLIPGLIAGVCSILFTIGGGVLLLAIMRSGDGRP
jgi:uncharacterized membrane protein YfcA